MGPIEASLRERAISARRRIEHATPIVIAWDAPLPARPMFTKIPRPTVQVDLPRLNISAIKELTPVPKDVQSFEELGAPFRSRAIVAEVCKKHRISFETIKGKQRSHPIVAAKFEAYYRLSTETTLSLPQIGRLMGGKDHTSILHGIRQHKARNGLEAA